MNICNGLLPWLLWSKKVRTNITALFVISIFVNIGMRFERYVIIVVSLAREPYKARTNAVYNPPWADWVIMAGSFGWFFMWFLLFVKNFPAVSISEVKEVLAPPRRGAGDAMSPTLRMPALFNAPPTPGVLGVFGFLDTTLDAIKKLRAAGHTDFTVFSPIPRHEIEDALGQPANPRPPVPRTRGTARCAALG